jgi:hypothetical protein
MDVVQYEFIKGVTQIWKNQTLSLFGTYTDITK